MDRNESKKPFAGHFAIANVIAAEPDRVSPAIEGYFRIPAIWVGDAPDPLSVSTLNPSIHHATALQMKMTCGIEVRVQRDGLFLFDFSGWSLAKATVVPGYVRFANANPKPPPEEHQRANERAEDVAVLRAQIMNVHQACLSTAERVIARRGADMGFPVMSWNTFKTTNLGFSPPYDDNPEDIHSLAHNVLNCKYEKNDFLATARRSLELEVVKGSLFYLDAILRRNERAMVELIEAAYISACRFRENRRGECIAIGWTVCEQLISIAWKRNLESENAKRKPTAQINAARRKKLSGRDYSASVMVEFLELHEVFSSTLYQRLEIVRKARNNWVHNMALPSAEAVLACQQSIEELLETVQGITIRLSYSSRGGVPLWRIGANLST